MAWYDALLNVGKAITSARPQPPGTPPGTPSTSLLDDLGRVAGATSAGRAAGRTTQADFNLKSAQAQQGQNQFNAGYGLNRAQAQQGANTETAATNLAQRQYEAQRHAQALKDALHGGMLQGATDATVSGTPYGVNVPTVTGGLRPSMITGAKDIGKSLQANANDTLALAPAADKTPVNFLGLPDPKSVSFDNLAPKPNAFDTTLNTVGTVSPLISILGKLAGTSGGSTGGSPSGGNLGLISSLSDLLKGGGGPSAVADADGVMHLPKSGGGILSASNVARGAAGVGGGIAAGLGIEKGDPLQGALGGAGVGSAIFPGIGTAIGAGVGALAAGIRRVAGNATNRQREAFAKQLTGSDDMNQFWSKLQTQVDPTTYQALYHTASRVIGKNDQSANQKWMSDVMDAIQRGKAAA